ncbi:MAG TPA: hypothetical protein VJH68_03845 [Candidatus Nanoarchaeia archaeon]|nr:hypothetical protein [Candidatus Nanoarchaeia archaeon]
MKFKAKKKYGSYKTPACAFCQRMATHKTNFGLETCQQHSKNSLPEIKCICGSWLEQKSGRFGPYFNCPKCGNVNFKKGLELKELTAKKAITETKIIPPEKLVLKEKKEITITSEDLEYFS